MSVELNTNTAEKKYDEGGKNAQKFFKKILEVDHKNFLANFYMALLLTDERKTSDALKFALKAKKFGGKEENVNLNIGCIYDLEGDEKRAAYYYNRELSLNPDNPQANFNLGVLYFDKKNWRKSIQYFEKCLILEHSFKESANFLARAYNHTGSLSEEMKVYEKLLNRDSRDVWALKNMGAACIDDDDNESAIKFLEAAKELDALDSSIDRNLQKAMSALYEQKQKKK